MASTAGFVVAYIWNAVYHFSGLFYIALLFQRTPSSTWPESQNSKTERLFQTLQDSSDYGQWLLAAHALDEHIPDNLEWKLDPKSQLYNWQQIQQRISDIQRALREENFQDAFVLLQFGMVRGLANITDARLYNRIYAGTKLLIERYVSNMLELVDAMFERPWNGQMLARQAKLDHAERFRTAYGKTGLILQGGSIFGLYHIGVMKALNERGLLPRVILGTGTGAIMAALAGMHPDSELSDFLSGRGINLDAFAGRSHDSRPTWYEIVVIFLRRINRFYQSGYVFDREALEKCVEDNVGDMTFREAYERSGRSVSITIEGDSPGTPNCLNYLTTPHVLIRTAAIASNEPDPDRAPALILQKNHRGEIEPWSLNDESSAYRKLRRKRQRRILVKDEVNSPMQRVSQLENVNHFIISQARPYLVPFLAPAFHRSNTPRARRAGFWSMASLKDFVIRSVGKELTHRMNQIDRIWGLPRRLRRFLVDEKIPFRSLTLVPEVDPVDFLRLLRNPTTAEIDHWITLGERSVWPCVAALEVRCSIEFALDSRYKVERRRPLHQIYGEEQSMPTTSAPKRKTRVRSTSAESNPI